MNAVLKVIQDRFKNCSIPGAREDKHKVALVVEGGGMRAVVSAGMLTAIARLGFLNCIDAVYGSSAGAINAAYFIANQPEYGLSVYYKNVNNSKFISYIRFVAKKPILSLAYLVNNIFEKEKKMDCEKILNSKIDLNILASSLDSKSLKVFSKFKEKEEIYTALKASSCIPWFAGSPIVIDNERFIDASFYNSIPFDIAVKDHCTHILVLRSWGRGFYKQAAPFYEKLIFSTHLRYLDKDMVDYYFKKRHLAYNESIKFLETVAPSITRPPYIYSIELERDECSINQLEKNSSKLILGAVSGYKAVLREFGFFNAQLVEVLMPYTIQGHPINFGDNF